MPTSPEYSTNQRKELIKDQSPLLNAFLDQKKLSDIDEWAGKLADITFDIEGEIDDNLGIGFTDLSTDLLLIAAKHQNVFRIDKDSSIFNQVAKTLFLIGHEIGEFEDANLFLIDIMVQLQRIRMLHPLIGSDLRIKEKTNGVIRSFLDSGAYIKEYYFPDSLDDDECVSPASEKYTDVPNFIKDFINQIPESPDNPIT